MRDQIKTQVLSAHQNNLILEYATGTGKTKMALEKVKQWGLNNILIVIPRLVLIDEWKKEINKWGIDITPKFSTYASIHKISTNWDIVVFDEAHHLSSRCLDVIREWHIKKSLFLSATIGKNLKTNLKYIFRDLHILNVNTKEAIEKEILPTPKILLLPLNLNNRKEDIYIYKNKATNSSITIPYKDKWQYAKSKAPYRIKCTQLQWYQDISGLISWYKQKVYDGDMRFQNRWMLTSNKRLKKLSDFKVEIINSILSHLQEQRCLVFCGDTTQSLAIKAFDINSKVGTSNLDKFNQGEINHISVVGMLDEGCNLVNCRIGIFNMINSSDRLNIQRIGRILRHKEPIIIFPYYQHTREEEIVQKLKDEYGENLFTIINNINEIQL